MIRKGLELEYYTRKAHAEGYPARSVYKLREINEKFHIFKKGDKVLDLGASPGSWLLYISEKVGARGIVAAIDIEELKSKTPSNAIFIKKDIAEIDFNSLKSISAEFDAVVSDMSPSTSGIRFLDAEMSRELSEKALEIALQVLKKGGNFICKIFEGERSEDFFKKVKNNFKVAKRFRPKAVRRESKEQYIVALNFQIMI